MEEIKQSALPDIRHTAVLNAPINKVWDAVATAEGLTSWFMPNDMKPEVGYEFLLNAADFGMSPCKVTEVNPPNRLAFNWGKDWTLAFELTEVDGRTEVAIIHSGWDAEKATEFGAPHSMVRDR